MTSIQTFHEDVRRATARTRRGGLRRPERRVLRMDLTPSEVLVELELLGLPVSAPDLLVLRSPRRTTPFDEQVLDVLRGALPGTTIVVLGR